MRVGIIGAGLGGLLTGAILASKGEEVEIFEKLPFPGGRFTSMPYRGYEVSTGALHMIPHGSRGPLAKLLRKAGADVEIVNSNPEAEILWDGEFENVTRKSFPFSDGLKLNLETLLLKLGRDRKLDEFSKSLSEKASRTLEAFLGWSFSVFPDQMRFSELMPIVEQTMKYRGPGVPVGGCRAVIDELVDIIESSGGKIHLRSEIRAIRPEGSVRIYGKDEREFDVLISNIGHRLTMKLAGREISTPPESRGVKYTIALKEPFIGHSGVLLTPGRKISGMNEVTNVDENLGERHMLQAHQPLRDGRTEEIAEGLRDLREILKGYEYEIIAVQSYRGDWPVNRVMAGKDTGCRTPFENVYVVGDGAKGKDIEVDGIALGVENLLEELYD
ncbi:NAD(P)-binding protein [Geoglobus acetivorans]|uniref:NAD(P)-binding protein n=1 Tax=Geoglobus acetivorans TaxID=565033 RepID=A0ABZ3H3W5_GEOAI|nr:NAD(P)-binding protein [Geoglobus acetivorans]